MIKKHEAGEGHSHAPRRYPSPASLAGAPSLTHRLPGPHASGGGHHTPNIPHDDRVSRNNGKKKLPLEFSPAQTMAKKSSRESFSEHWRAARWRGDGDALTSMS